MPERADGHPVEVDRGAVLQPATGEQHDRLRLLRPGGGRDALEVRRGTADLVDGLQAPDRVEDQVPDAGCPDVQHTVDRQAVGRREAVRVHPTVEGPGAPEAEPEAPAVGRLRGDGVGAACRNRRGGEVEGRRCPRVGARLGGDAVRVHHDELQPTGARDVQRRAARVGARREGALHRVQHLGPPLGVAGGRCDDGLDEVPEVAVPGRRVDVARARDLGEKVLATVPAVAERRAVDAIGQRTLDRTPDEVHAVGRVAHRERLERLGDPVELRLRDTVRKGPVDLHGRVQVGVATRLRHRRLAEHDGAADGREHRVGRPHRRVGVDLHPAVLQRVAEAEQDRAVERGCAARGVAHLAARVPVAVEPDGRAHLAHGVADGLERGVWTEVEQGDSRPVDREVGDVLQPDPHEERVGAA